MRFLFLILSLFFTLQVHAHHPTAPMSSSFRAIYFQGNQTLPTSRVYVSNQYQYLDNSVGDLFTLNIGGEWALTKRFSLLGQIPINHLAYTNQHNQWGLGDISFGGKFAFLQNKYLLFSSAQILLPTGNEYNGFGRPTAAALWDVFGGINFNEWVLYVNPALSFGFGAPHEPVLSGAFGLESPYWFNERINVGLSLQWLTYLGSDTFSSGSSKLTAGPQINWNIDSAKKWTLSQSVQISVVDELSLKSGVILNNTSTALLNDTLCSVTTTLNFKF